MSQILAISHGEYEMGVAPRAGGSLAYFRHAGADLMRPFDAAGLAADNPRAGAGFPMVPYCGRLAHGRFARAGRVHQLALNFAPSPHAIHGNGWARAWSVVEQAARAITLRLDHQPDEAWPFAYGATQTFAVGEDVSWTLSIENRDRHAMPAGLGFHPYFIRTPATTLTANVRAMWQADEHLLPTREVPSPFVFANTGMDATRVDACFTGWDGRAEIRWPELGRRLVLTGDPGHLVVFSPPSPAFLCVEPQSMMPDAFNRGGGALLAPGAALSVIMRWTVAPLGG